MHWAIVRENREFLEYIISRLFKDEPTNEMVKKNFSAILSKLRTRNETAAIHAFE